MDERKDERKDEEERLREKKNEDCLVPNTQCWIDADEAHESRKIDTLD